LESPVAMYDGDGFPDPDRVVRRQVVDEPDEDGRPAAAEEGRTGDHAVVAPDGARRQPRMKRVKRLPLVDQEELGVRRHHARPTDVDGRGPVHVHAVGRIGTGGKARDGLRDGCDGKLFEEGRRRWARWKLVRKDPATSTRAEQDVA